MGRRGIGVGRREFAAMRAYYKERARVANGMPTKGAMNQPYKMPESTRGESNVLAKPPDGFVQTDAKNF